MFQLLQQQFSSHIKHDLFILILKKTLSINFGISQIDLKSLAGDIRDIRNDGINAISKPFKQSRKVPQWTNCLRSTSEDMVEIGGKLFNQKLKIEIPKLERNISL